MTRGYGLTVIILLGWSIALLSGCGPTTAPAPTSQPHDLLQATAGPTSTPGARPGATSVSQATAGPTSTPEATAGLPFTPEATAGEQAYPIYDIGLGTTWDDRPMAFLLTELAALNPADPAFEQQLRWGWGLLYERYSEVEVLELILSWKERYSMIFDATVSDWKALTAGQLPWAAFWDRLERQLVDLETGDLYEGSDVDAFLAELATGAVPSERPTLPAAPTPSPTRLALPTAGPAPTRPQPTTPPGIVLGATYEDPAGFFTIDYPNGWLARKSGSEMQFRADAQGNTAVAISLQIKALSAQALVDDFSTFFSERWDNYQEVSRETSTISGYPAVWVEQTYSYDGTPQHGLLVGVVRNRVGFLLIAWSPEEEYAEREPYFRAIVQSLRLTDFPEAPPYEEWSSYKGEHLVFHYLPGTWVARQIRSIAADHEQAFEDIVRILDVDYRGPIDFYLYTSEESFYRATARDAGFAIPAGNEVHSQWYAPDHHQSLGHEMTHVITYWTLGEPSEALFGEGIAVCLDHSGKDYRQIGADLDAQGQLIPLAQMLGDAWFDYENAYPVSGSFVCFLLERYGVSPFKEAYPQSDLEAALKQAYGKDLATLEQEWLEWLRSY